jgi:hypothetical protein
MVPGTPKEQAVYGRVLRNGEDPQATIAAFVETSNPEWRLEKLAFMTPREVREELVPGLAAQMLSWGQETGRATDSTAREDPL